MGEALTGEGGKPDSSPKDPGVLPLIPPLPFPPSSSFFHAQQPSISCHSTHRTILTHSFSPFLPPFFPPQVIRLDCLAIDPIENPFNEAAAYQLLLQNEASLGPLPPSLPRLHAAFKDQHHLYLMTPYAPGGDLFNYLARRPPARRHLSERKACAFLLDIIEALSYLNKAGIAHRDVSLENVVLSLGEVMTEDEVRREEAEDWVGSAPLALHLAGVGGGGAAAGGTTAAATAGAADAGGQQRRVHDQCVLLPAPYPEVLLGEQASLSTMPHFFHSTGYGPVPPPGSYSLAHNQQAGHVSITVGQEARAAEASALVPPPPPQAHHYRHHYYNVLHPPASSSSSSSSSSSFNTPSAPPQHHSPSSSPPPSLPPPPRRHWHCTLIDLGMAARLPESKSGFKIQSSNHQSRGKPGYVSPEVFYEQPSDGFSSDIWSLGVMLYTFLTGHPLYASPWDPAFEALVGGETRRLIHHYKVWFVCMYIYIYVCLCVCVFVFVCVCVFAYVPPFLK